MRITFFDLETQYLFDELRMSTSTSRDPTKLRLAIAGTLTNNKHAFYTEDQIQELYNDLRNADLIVGHNLLNFDYLVLQPYLGKKKINTLKNNTFDTFDYLRKVTGCYISLDDLGKRNVGLTKTIDTLKIPKMWRDGRIKEVKEYLLNDLRMTEAVYKHGKNTKKFKYEYKEYGKSIGIKEVIVNW